MTRHYGTVISREILYNPEGNHFPGGVEPPVVPFSV
jgi:hypothetical protein